MTYIVSAASALGVCVVHMCVLCMVYWTALAVLFVYWVMVCNVYCVLSGVLFAFCIGRMLISVALHEDRQSCLAASSCDVYGNMAQFIEDL